MRALGYTPPSLARRGVPVGIRPRAPSFAWVEGENAMKLQDPRLFHEQCYIDGVWCHADDKATVEVTNPAGGDVIGTESWKVPGGLRNSVALWIASPLPDARGWCG